MHEANRVKLAEMMPEGARGVALLQGGEQQMRYDTDHEPVFRQESYFQYLFGVSEAGCYGAVALPSARATLFVPKLGEDYEVFCGQYPPAEDFEARYGVEEVRYLDELPAWLEEQLGAEGRRELEEGGEQQLLRTPDWCAVRCDEATEEGEEAPPVGAVADGGAVA